MAFREAKLTILPFPLVKGRWIFMWQDGGFWLSRQLPACSIRPLHSALELTDVCRCGLDLEPPDAPSGGAWPRRALLLSILVRHKRTKKFKKFRGNLSKPNRGCRLPLYMLFFRFAKRTSAGVTTISNKSRLELSLDSVRSWGALFRLLPNEP